MNINSFQVGDADAKKIIRPIRGRSDVIKTLMEAVRFISMGANPRGRDIVGELVVCIDKMKRIFLFLEGYYFTIRIPFEVYFSEDGLSFYYDNLGEINSNIVSLILGIINDERFYSDSPLDFADPIDEAESDAPGIWGLMRELMTFEDGYLRYEVDHERQDPDLHPLNHIDFFYSNSSTFKVGLSDPFSMEDLKRMVDVKKSCVYLKF